MNQHLRNTYLKQMNIEVWEKRPASKQPEWIIVHDQSESLQGKSEQLLNAMIASIGKKRDDVYITDLVTYQKQKYTPKVVLVLGQNAAQHLLHTEQTPIIMSYHPSDLLQNPIDKSKAFADWLRIKTFI